MPRSPCSHAWEPDLPRPRRPLRGARTCSGTLGAPPCAATLRKATCQSSVEMLGLKLEVKWFRFRFPVPVAVETQLGRAVPDWVGFSAPPVQNTLRVSGLLRMIPRLSPGLFSAFSSSISHISFTPAGSAQAHHLRSAEHRRKVPCPQNSTTWPSGTGAWNTIQPSGIKEIRQRQSMNSHVKK